jgi:beta-carotene 3-hydroxylase
MRTVLVAILAFVLMEPVTCGVHRFVMHGFGARLHTSHHRVRRTRWEANDLFPVLFAGAVMTALAFGYDTSWEGTVVPAAVGVTAYGVVYGVVHDLYIHRRFGVLRVTVPLLDRLAEAHRIHHLYGGAPYGMLLPVVPAELRARAARTTRNPLVAAGS